MVHSLQLRAQEVVFIELSHHVTELVQCVIEGEARVLAASMIMEGFCKGAKEHKQEVFEKVQPDLNQFGLLIYDDNVKQLLDVPDCEYFPYLGQETQMEIGVKEREGESL